MVNLKEKLSLLPESSGVYIMLDAGGNIIYVGKAKNLKRRVKQYFYASVKTEKTMLLVESVVDFRYILTPSEIDALSLESTLIKKHKPKYNVLLKDDKQYPFISVNLKEKFPVFRITRRVKKDGAKYFGPFMNGVNPTAIIEIICFAYKLRLCNISFNKAMPPRACLNYDIGLCGAPCQKFINEKEYLEKVKKGIDFINGENGEVRRILKEKMEACAENLEFELAIKYKEKLEMLDKIDQKKITAQGKIINVDCFSFASNDYYSVISVLVVRSGRVQGEENFYVENSGASLKESLSSFIIRYYEKTKSLPEEIIIPEDIGNEICERYLREVYLKSVNMIIPQKGLRRALLDMAKSNAYEYLEKNGGIIERKRNMTVGACNGLKSALNLSRYPKRIECYDISHISGTQKVGSMVVFEDGEKASKEYRRFKIKTVEGVDDFKCLQEVLERRFEKLKEENQKFSAPDLIVIDGGKGQLNSVKEIFDRYNYDIDLISLAKREEEVFLPEKSESVILDKHSQELKLLQRVRDEAHRFAITYHRNLRLKTGLQSCLEEISGIGKTLRKNIMERFKSVENIKKASLEEIMQVEKIGKVKAKEIYDYFRGENL